MRKKDISVEAFKVCFKNGALCCPSWFTELLLERKVIVGKDCIVICGFTETGERSLQEDIIVRDGEYIGKNLSGGAMKIGFIEE